MHVVSRAVQARKAESAPEVLHRAMPGPGAGQSEALLSWRWWTKPQRRERAERDDELALRQACVIVASREVLRCARTCVTADQVTMALDMADEGTQMALKTLMEAQIDYDAVAS